ncbi:CLUMA_CG013496, isoform A [Clunio marinus]|uniref:CLUMA_CG013496, isoform A n=1 Tax=Clunio marinus TaxID=568069 RepID=A0A1J1IMB6_9DIPT|nr:CLUMA_CG013496, isoform A [Clunio marinus]
MKMLKFVLVILCCSIFDRSEGKVYEKCELVQTLIESFNATIEIAEKLACIAEQTSEFDTQFMQNDSYGIFNISCGSQESTLTCNNNFCLSLLDDNLDDDFECALEQLEEWNDIEYSFDNSTFNISDCNISEEDNEIDLTFDDEDVPSMDSEITYGTIIPIDIEGITIENPIKVFEKEQEYEQKVDFFPPIIQKFHVIHDLIQTNYDRQQNVKYIFLFV